MAIVDGSCEDVFPVEMEKSDTEKHDDMAKDKDRRVAYLLPWDRLLEETTPGIHVCREQIRTDAFEQRHIQGADDGKQDDDRHGRDDRAD